MDHGSAIGVGLAHAAEEEAVGDAFWVTVGYAWINSLKLHEAPRYTGMHRICTNSIRIIKMEVIFA